MTDKDIQSKLEKALNKSKSQKFIFRLYISGAGPKSARAVENIRQLSEKYLKGRYELQVIDVYQHPNLAKKEQIIAAPTLIKKLPLPLRRYIGDLSDSEKVLLGMEIKEKKAKTDKKTDK